MNISQALIKYEIILKVVLWRLISFLIAIALTYIYFGEWSASINFAVILNVVLICCHYLYEKMWPVLKREYFYEKRRDREDCCN